MRYKCCECEKEYNNIPLGIWYDGYLCPKCQVDELKAHIKEQIKICDNHVDEIDRRGKEIDKLKVEIEELEGTNRMWKDEIDRLTDANERMADELPDDFLHLD